MPNEFRPLNDGAGGLLRQFKVIGTHPVTGENIYAETLALEPDSIGAGGSGGSGGVADLQVRNAGDTAWVPVGPNNAHVPVDISSVVHVDDNGGSLTVDGTVGVNNFPATQPVSGPVTDAQLRASAVPVTIPTPTPVTDNGGSLTVDGSVAVSNFPGTQPVSGPLTDTQLRASDVSVLVPRLPAALDADGGVKIHAQSAIPVTDNAGSLTVDGTVGVNNFPSVQPVNDNSGSLTVDAPVGTPVFTRLSDGSAALIGQKAMSASLPVVLASDQAAIPVTVGGTTPLGTYMAASFRLTGAASSPTNLLTIENTAGSAVTAKIRRIAIDVVSTATTAYLVAANFRLWHVTGVTPTGGTSPTKTKQNSTDTASAANVVLRFPASADGTASAITHALPSRSPDKSQAHPTQITGVGQWLTDDLTLVDWGQTALTLRAGETLLVALVGNSATVFSYTVKVQWEEY